MRRAFTLIHLLVVIGILGFIVAIMLPSLCKSRETANRVKCQSNLSQIGKAIMLYCNDNNGSYPRTHYVPGAPVSLTNDGAADPNPFIITRVNSIPAAQFLLVRTQDMTTEVFTCPSGTAEKDLMDNQAATQRSNFTGADGAVTRNVAYSFYNVYPSTAASKAAYMEFPTMPGTLFPIAADLAPAPPDDAALRSLTVQSPRNATVKGNSRNHDGDGQNVLYSDGHAEFQQTPLCGHGNDNVFTAKHGGADPADGTDSILLIHQP